MWNMDTQREEVQRRQPPVSRVSGAGFDCFSVSAGASVARQRLLSEVRAAVLLEHQADVGQQDPRAAAGKGASGGRRSLSLPSVTPRLCFSTTAGSAERPFVGNAAPSAPRTPSWASSSPCACATPALRPSEKKSELRGFFFPPSQSLLLKETLTFSLCSRTALATFHEGKHNIGRMDMDPSRGLMVTCGSDRIVKVGVGAARQPTFVACTLLLRTCVAGCLHRSGI